MENTTTDTMIRGGASVRLAHTLRALSLLLPLPDRMKVKIYYGIFTDFFEMLAQGTDMFNYGQEYLCDETVKTLPQSGKWLDVGCGVGGPATYFAGKNDRIDITGINITPAQVERAIKNADKKGLSHRVRFQIGDACNMPFRENHLFDGLYAIETAFHFPDKPAFIREARRVLKPGAPFACADMVMREEGVETADQFWSRLFHKYLGIMNMYTVSEWRKIMEDAGFSDFSVEDVTASVLKDGLEGANERIRNRRDEFEHVFPKFIVDMVVKNNEWTLADVEKRPTRYVIFRAIA